jgi:NTP pyrophosphatase (non-canonical NTP hydrolase)
MDLQEYQKKVLKNFKPRRDLTSKESAILDWTLGIAGEAGEIIDEIQHIIFHKQNRDIMELAKEIGDCFWYLTALCAELGISIEDILELNVAKLNYRHGGHFTYDTSVNKLSTELSFKDTRQFSEIRRRIENGRRRESSETL